MPAIHVDTIEDFHRVRAAIEPVYITSKARGRILVPCANTILVRVRLVVDNLYNPNAVSPDKMQALEENILASGFCFPIVVIWDEDLQCFVVVDGAHRRAMLSDEWLDCDYLPLVVLDLTMAQRLAATWRFNKARGHHQVDLDAELIRKMLAQGVSEEEIAPQLCVDLDTVHRYKQVAGVAEVFKNAEWSRSWTMVEEPEPAVS